MHETNASGVSWGAVLGGAFVTASLSLILLALGAGLGLSAVSPWNGVGVSASAVGNGVIAWIVFIEIVASALGGYLSGRLRTKWATIHTDEVYFRDTANGFLSWAVAVVISVTFLVSAGASMVGGAAQMAAVEGAKGVDHNAYFVDELFRADQVPQENREAFRHVEASRIFANALTKDDIAAADRKYLAQTVSQTTGLSAADADKRVSDVIAEARQAEDVTRKATARMLLWFFLALLMGAFSASYAATIGGRQRDHVKLV